MALEPPARAVASLMSSSLEKSGAPRRSRRTMCTMQLNMATTTTTSGQGLTLDDFSAQRKRLLCTGDASKGCLGGVQEVSRGIRQWGA